MAKMQESDIAVTVTVDAVYPGVGADEPTLLATLAELSRDDALFYCGRLNTLISGFGPHRNNHERQTAAVNLVCTLEQRRALAGYACKHGGPESVMVFFRGQLLELARWVVTHCQNKPGDGETFNDPAVRSAFVRAALIVSGLWAQRVFGSRLEGPGLDRDKLLHAL